MLTVLGEAGRDQRRHLLVNVACSFCKGTKVMRKSNLKRSKSCGCVQQAKRDRIIAEHNKQPIILPDRKLPESAFSEYDNSNIGPRAICAKVYDKGLFVSAIKPKS